MIKFLNYWGSLSKQLLMDSSSHEIHRQYRVEVTLNSEYSIYQHLDSCNVYPDASKLLDQLVRRSILIELPESTGKEGSARRTARFQIRASLLPTYSLSFTRKNYVPIKSIEEFSKFLECDETVKNRLLKKVANSGMRDLFDDKS